MQKVAASLVAIVIVVYFAATFAAAVKGVDVTTDKIKAHNSSIAVAASL